MNRLIPLLPLLLLPACAALQDTPEQTRARLAWKQCESSFPSVQVTRVYADGSSEFAAASPGALAAAHDCMKQAHR